VSIPDDPRITRSRVPFREWNVVRPSSATGAIWSHYGVFLPTLPAPHKYLGVMTLIGMPGSRVFDHVEYLETVAQNDRRRLATVMASTAAEGQHHLAGYDVETCHFAPDGSRLLWPRQDADYSIEIDGLAEPRVASPPVVSAKGRFKDWSFDLMLRTSPEAAWYVNAPGIYEHFSVLARATGSITDASGRRTVIDANCSFEFGMTTPRPPKPEAVDATKPKTPRSKIERFVYQVVNLDDSRQLLLGHSSGDGRVRRSYMGYRRKGKPTEYFIESEVELKILSYQTPEYPNAVGNDMRVPARFVWTARRGDQTCTVDGEVVDRLRVGHGQGFAGSFNHRTTLPTGESFSGFAYIEWVDLSEKPEV
jgi:hypothetical protein